MPGAIFYVSRRWTQKAKRYGAKIVRKVKKTTKAGRATEQHDRHSPKPVTPEPVYFRDPELAVPEDENEIPVPCVAANRPMDLDIDQLTALGMPRWWRWSAITEDEKEEQDQNTSGRPSSVVESSHELQTRDDTGLREVGAVSTSPTVWSDSPTLVNGMENEDFETSNLWEG